MSHSGDSRVRELAAELAAVKLNAAIVAESLAAETEARKAAVAELQALKAAQTPHSDAPGSSSSLRAAAEAAEFECERLRVQVAELEGEVAFLKTRLSARDAAVSSLGSAGSGAVAHLQAQIASKDALLASQNELLQRMGTALQEKIADLKASQAQTQTQAQAQAQAPPHAPDTASDPSFNGGGQQQVAALVSSYTDEILALKEKLAAAEAREAAADASLSHYKTLHQVDVGVINSLKEEIQTSSAPRVARAADPVGPVGPALSFERTLAAQSGLVLEDSPESSEGQVDYATHSAIVAQYEELRNKAKGLQEAAAASEARAKVAEAELERKTSAVRDALREALAREEEAAGLRSDCASLSALLEKTRSERDEVATRVARAESENALLRDRVQALAEELGEAKALLHETTARATSTAEAHRVLGDEYTELRKIFERVSASNVAKEEELERQQVTVDTLQSRYDVAEAQLGESRSLASSLESRVQALESQLASKAQDLVGAEQARDAALYNKQLMEGKMSAAVEAKTKLTSQYESLVLEHETVVKAAAEDRKVAEEASARLDAAQKRIKVLQDSSREMSAEFHKVNAIANRVEDQDSLRETRELASRSRMQQEDQDDNHTPRHHRHNTSSTVEVVPPSPTLAAVVTQVVEDPAANHTPSKADVVVLELSPPLTTPGPRARLVPVTPVARSRQAQPASPDLMATPMSRSQQPSYQAPIPVSPGASMVWTPPPQSQQPQQPRPSSGSTSGLGVSDRDVQFEATVGDPTELNFKSTLFISGAAVTAYATQPLGQHGPPPKVELVVHELGDSTVRVVFTPHERCLLDLHVVVDGVELPASPLLVSVVDAAPSSSSPPPPLRSTHSSGSDALTASALETSFSGGRRRTEPSSPLSVSRPMGASTAPFESAGPGVCRECGASLGGGSMSDHVPFCPALQECTMCGKWIPSSLIVAHEDKHYSAQQTLAEAKPFVGIRVADEGGPSSRGVVVETARKNGPAYQAGIRDGDVILAVNGKRVPSRAAFGKVMEDAAVPGAIISVELERGGELMGGDILVGAAGIPIETVQALASLTF